MLKNKENTERPQTTMTYAEALADTDTKEEENKSPSTTIIARNIQNEWMKSLKVSSILFS